MAAENDPDMKQYARKLLLATAATPCKAGIQDFILSGGQTYDSIIMEIRAGTGGDARQHYSPATSTTCIRHYARDQGWKVEDIPSNPGEQGGYKEVVFSIKGDEAFQQFQSESGGGHRVHAFPNTETQGRIHTSAATVAVLPEPDEVQVEIKDSDIEWERMRAPGAGGQHVNKTETAPSHPGNRNGTPDEFEGSAEDALS